MRRRLAAGGILLLGLATTLATGPAAAAPVGAGPMLVPLALEAPDQPAVAGAAGDACTAPTPDPSGTVKTYA